MAVTHSFPMKSCYPPDIYIQLCREGRNTEICSLSTGRGCLANGWESLGYGDTKEGKWLDLILNCLGDGVLVLDGEIAAKLCAGFTTYI